MDLPRTTKTVFLWLLAVLSSCLMPVPASAHKLPPLPLGLWGPFARPVTRCMRGIGNAAQRCFREVVGAERTCMDAELGGLGCDVARRAASVAAAQGTAQSVVTDVCLGGQLTELRFADFNDARADLLRACAHADGAVDLMYGPAAATTIGTAERQCVVQAAAMGAKFVEVVMRAKTAVLDHAAARIVPPIQPMEKLRLLTKANDRVATARAILAAQLGQMCPRFADVYGLDPSSFLTALEQRADCVLGIMYVQTSISCQLPFCGNGLTEPGEQCDDANANDDDACHTNCTLP